MSKKCVVVVCQETATQEGFLGVQGNPQYVEAARAVACPYCKQQAGQSCIDMRGWPVAAHRRRHAALKREAK